jgi:hypothetical protein
MMNNQILNDGTVLYYALKVDGRIVTPPMLERFMLEDYKKNLPSDQQGLAEVVMVTPDGKEMLLG